jgi:NlpC/P60 family protein
LSVDRQVLRKSVKYVWRAGFLIWLTLTIWPVSYGMTRLAQVVLLFGLWTGAIFLWWRHLWVRWSVLGFGGGLIAVTLLPGREADAGRLRARYQGELLRFQGTRYTWGGENRLGIDCSGLVRRALLHALWKESLRTANPRLARKALELWWYDSSARAISNEYRHQTRRVTTAAALSEFQQARLHAGDMAVTTDGVHVLAYLTDGTWIEADPDARRVTLIPTVDPRDISNIWLNVPVTIVRWRVLEGPETQ